MSQAHQQSLCTRACFYRILLKESKSHPICTVWFYNQREVNTVSAQSLVFIYLGLRERGFQRNFKLLFIKMIGRWYFTRRGHWNQADIIVMGRDSLPFYKRTGVCAIGIPASLWKDVGNLACYRIQRRHCASQGCSTRKIRSNTKVLW